MNAQSCSQKVHRILRLDGQACCSGSSLCRGFVTNPLTEHSCPFQQDAALQSCNFQMPSQLLCETMPFFLPLQPYQTVACLLFRYARLRHADRSTGRKPRLAVFRKKFFCRAQRWAYREC